MDARFAAIDARDVPSAMRDHGLERLLGAPRSRVVWTEPWPRRVRAFFAGVVVADSTRVRLLLESRRLPVYYFPPDDVRIDLLELSSWSTRCPRKGVASYWALRVGERVARDAVWSYHKPNTDRADIAGCFAFWWNALDAWFEEDDEVFVHPRSPYHRVDVLHSSRRVRVELAGEIVAETTRPRLLFETQLPVRYYIPPGDVRMELLEPSPKTTRCPYKGIASYWSVRLGAHTLTDIAWTYRSPIPECPKIAGLISFYNERSAIWVDGERASRR